MLLFWWTESQHFDFPVVKRLTHVRIFHSIIVRTFWNSWTFKIDLCQFPWTPWVTDRSSVHRENRKLQTSFQGEIRLWKRVYWMAWNACHLRKLKTKHSKSLVQKLGASYLQDWLSQKGDLDGSSGCWIVEQKKCSQMDLIIDEVKQWISI